MKKISLLVLAAVLMFSVYGCSEAKEIFKSEYSEEYDYYGDAVSMFKTKAGLTAEEADKLFVALTEKGMATAPTSFYQMTDKDGVKYYNLTSGLKIFKVYLSDGEVTQILDQSEATKENTTQADSTTPENNTTDNNTEDNKTTDKNPQENNTTVENNDTSVNNNSTVTQKSEDSSSPAKDPEKETTEPKKIDSGTVSSESSIKLISLTSPVDRNQKATLKIKGTPNTSYTISVYYSSGASTASGLEAKISDSSGYVSWTWKIGGKTKAGNHRIVITGGSDTLETSIETTE